MPCATPPLLAVPGSLPDFWPHRVIFFANLRSLFFGNNAETDELCHTVGNVDSYGGRLLPILNILFRGSGNILVLECEPDAALLRYFRNRLGLKPPEYRVIDHRTYQEIGRLARSGTARDIEARLPAIRDWSGAVIDGYVTDSTLTAIADTHALRTLCSPEGSWRGNNKLLLHTFLEQSGLPVFETIIATTPADLPGALAALHDRGFRRAVVKAQIGASGIGLRRVDLPASSAEIARIPAMLFHEGPCLVQGWIEPGVNDVAAIRSPSVQLFVGDDSIHLYDLTEQILSRDSIHEGNEAIPRFLRRDAALKHDMLAITGAAARWLHAQGYRGPGSADFVVAFDRDGRTHPPILCEINARITGATYPAVLARLLAPAGAWLMRNIRFPSAPAGTAILQALDTADLLYRRGAATGLLPINFNPHPRGGIAKAQLLALAPSLRECRQMIDTLPDRLHLEITHDRD